MWAEWKVSVSRRMMGSTSVASSSIERAVSAKGRPPRPIWARKRSWPSRSSRSLVTWSGKHRPALDDAGIYPRPVQPELPVWIAVGGTPASVVRAGSHGLPLYLAILGQPERFEPLADLYRSTGGMPATNPMISESA